MITDQESVELPGGRVLSRGQFYAERDHRTQINAPFAAARATVAIVAAPGLASTVAGQTALIWTASMVRRMGQPFAALRVVSDPALRDAEYRGSLHSHVGITRFWDAIELELRGADPFSDFDWKNSQEPGSLTGVDAAIGIGINPALLDASCPLAIEVCARGWVVHLRSADSGSCVPREEAAGSSLLDCADSTAVAAACLGVAQVYEWFQRHSGSGVELTQNTLPNATAPSELWWSVDMGSVTTDSADGLGWMTSGSSELDPAPWGTAQGPAPALPRIALVSAGGIGGNLAEILSGSFVTPGLIEIIDPDQVDIGNLNRLIGVLVRDVTSAKANVYSRGLGAAGFRVTAAAMPYEEWAIGHRSFLDAVDCVSIVGADQVGTRLEAQADWPAKLFNASTAGTTWTVSRHLRGRGGCLGCIYASDRRPYAASRGPEACAVAGGGLPGSAGPALADASYPFVSACAAAALAATIIRDAWHVQTAPREAHASGPDNTTTARPSTAELSVTRMNVRSPVFTQAGNVVRHPDCLLLCSEPVVRELFEPLLTASGVANEQ